MFTIFHYGLVVATNTLKTCRAWPTDATPTRTEHDISRAKAAKMVINGCATSGSNQRDERAAFAHVRFGFITNPMQGDKLHRLS